MDDEEAARRYKSGFWSIGMCLSWMICRTAEAVMYAAKCDEPDAKGRFSPPSAYWALHIGSLEALRDPNARDPRLFADAQSAMDALVRAVLEKRVRIRSMSTAKVGFEGEIRSAPDRYVAPPADWSDGAAIFHDRQHGYVIYGQSAEIMGYTTPVFYEDTGRMSEQFTFTPAQGANFCKYITLDSRSIRSAFPGLSGPSKSLILDRRWQAQRLCEHIVQYPVGHKLDYVNCSVEHCDLKTIKCKTEHKNCVKWPIDTGHTMISIASDIANATDVSQEMADVLLRRAIDAIERRGEPSAASWRKKQRGGQPSKTGRGRR